MEELEKTSTQDSFLALNRVIAKMANVSLKVLEKSGKFLFKKGYEPCNIDTFINRHPTEKKYVLRRGFVRTYMKCLYVTGQTI